VAEEAAAVATPAHAPSAIERLTNEARSLPGVKHGEIEHGELVLDVDASNLLTVLTLLRDDPRFACEQLMELCGVDWPERPERFDVVYMLLSISLNHRVRVMVRTGAETPVPSIHRLWPVATWFEREAWDLFGISFSDQPDLRRILTDYGFSGHPLRKDFPLTGYVEVRYDEDRKRVVNEPVTLTQDFRNFDFVSPWEGMVTLPGDEKAHTDRQNAASSDAAANAVPSDTAANKDSK